MGLYESLTIIGICFILKYGSILNFIRTPLIKFKFFNELFSCALCLGFHIGLWIAICSGTPSIWGVLSLAFYSSAICWFSDHIIMMFQTYIYGRDVDK